MSLARGSSASQCLTRQIHSFHIPRRRLVTVDSSSILKHNDSLQRPFIIPILRNSFSTSSVSLAKPKGRPEIDRRITLIRYFLNHYRTPRPLRLSRGRSLRHWTIHRAWQLFKAKQRQTRELELERQYNSMRDACEALRLIGENGLAVDDGSRVAKPTGARDLAAVEVKNGDENIAIDIAGAAMRQNHVGRWYRGAMNKEGVFDGMPIEYARSQTDTPRRDGWEKNWKR